MSRGRTIYRTPSTNRKRARSSVSRSTRRTMSIDRSKSLPRRMLEGAARSLSRSYGGPLGAAVADSVISGLTTKRRVSRTVSAGGGMGSSINRKKSKYRRKKRKTIVKKNVVESKGIIANSEIRFTSKTNEGTKIEALAIGHTTLPVKHSLLNLCRALVKVLAKRMNVELKDLGDLPNMYFPLIFPALPGTNRMFINYYLGWNATTLQSWSVNCADPPLNTWDELAYRLFLLMQPVADAGNIRFNDFGFTGNDIFTPIVMNLSDMKVQVCSQSILKVQNRTINEAGDEDATEVDNVPLHGAQFICKGNNLMRKTNWQLLGPWREGDESLLYTSWGPTTAVWNFDYDQPYLADNSQSVTRKPNDIPKKGELLNCLSTNRFTHNPGVIRSSYITQKFEMSIQAYLKLLLGSRGANNDSINFAPNLGKTAVLWYDKVIGGSQTDVSIKAECQLRQGVYCIHKTVNKTLPVNFQFDQTEA